MKFRERLFVTLGIMILISSFSVISTYGATTITMWGPWNFDARSGDEYAQVVQELFKKFETENPDIKLQYSQVPDYEQKFRISAAAGQLPDLFGVDGINSAAYAYRGLLTPLDDYLPADLINDYFEPALDEMTWDGKTYAIAQETNCHALFYNRDILAEAGLEPPDTWEELVERGEKLTVDIDGDGKTDQYGMELVLGRNEYAMWILTPYIWMKGGSIINEDGTKATVNQPEAVEAIQFLSDLVNKYKIVPKAGSIQAGPEGAFVAGKIAMSHLGPYMIPSYKSSYPNFNWDLIHLPKPSDGKRVSGVGGWHWSIYSKTKHLDEAIKVIEFLSSEEWTRAVALKYRPPGARISVAEKLPIVHEHPWSVAFEAMVKYGRARPRSPHYPQITNAVQEALDNAIIGNMPVQEVLDEAARKIDTALAGK